MLDLKMVHHFLRVKQKLMMFVDEANHIYIVMPMYSLIEFSDNYSDTSASLWLFKRDEVPTSNPDLRIDNSKSFKYKAALVGKNSRCY